MTTPSDSGGNSVSPLSGSPYTDDGTVPLPGGDVDRHPYNANDFGITPRAIDPAAFGGAPEHPTEGDSGTSGTSGNGDDSGSSVPSALAGAGVAAAATAALGAVIAKATGDDGDNKGDNKGDKKDDKQKDSNDGWHEESQRKTRDSYTGEEEITTVRKKKVQRGGSSEGPRRGDIGIYVPLGFAVICLAILLALFLFELPGSWVVGASIVLILCLIVTAITTLELMVTARRRRKAGEDMAHAIGLE